MSRVTLNDAYLTATANAIRSKTGGSGTMTPAQFADAIGSISGGGSSSVFGYDIRIFEDFNSDAENSGALSLNLTNDEYAIGALCFCQDVNNIFQVAGGGFTDDVTFGDPFFYLTGIDGVFDDAENLGELYVDSQMSGGLLVWNNTIPYALLIVVA